MSLRSGSRERRDISRLYGSKALRRMSGCVTVLCLITPTYLSISDIRKTQLMKVENITIGVWWLLLLGYLSNTRRKVFRVRENPFPQGTVCVYRFAISSTSGLNLDKFYCQRKEIRTSRIIVYEYTLSERLIKH